jgi:DNA-binding XRE family transcriptional regulator
MSNRGRPKTTVKERIEDKTFDFEKIEKLAMHGLTDAEIADILDVNEATVNRWKKDPDFMQALKKGKDLADAVVENALYHRAIGFKHKDLYITQFQGQIVKEEIEKIYPPDPTSMIFWLKNRKPKEWRDKQDVELSGEVTNNLTVLTPEKRKKRIDDLKKKLNANG